jgi:hypothetical protein
MARIQAKKRVAPKAIAPASRPRKSASGHQPFLEGHGDYLNERLKKATFAAMYLNSALETGDAEFFRAAVRDVMKAQGVAGTATLKGLLNLNLAFVPNSRTSKTRDRSSS